MTKPLIPFQQIFEHLYDGVIVTNLDGEILHWNRGAEIMFGYRKEDVRGKTPAILHEPETAKTLMASIIAACHREGYWTGEIRFVRMDGSQGVCETCVMPVLGGDGDPVGLVGVNRDITARKRAEQGMILRIERQNSELYQTKNRFDYVVSKLPGAAYICRMDDDMTPRFVSPGIERVTGYSPQRFLSNPSFWAENVHSEDRERVMSEAAQIVEGGCSGSVEYRFRHALGHDVWVHDELNVVCDADGVPVEVVGYQTDISEKKFAEEESLATRSILESRVAERTAELQAAKERLEKALADLQASAEKTIQHERLRAIGELASGASHNLNNMLTPSLVLTEMLLEDAELSANAAAMVRTIRTGAQDAADLVQRLGELYRDPGDAEQLESLDLSLVLREIPELTSSKWRNEAQKTGREIRCVAKVESAVHARTNPSELRQVLTNLVFNAVDAMPQGGEITLLLERCSGTARITVRDNGEGMSAEVLKRCRDLFFTTKRTGTGLGLATCARIIASHSGILTIDSALERGTSVRIDLPSTSAERFDSPSRPEDLPLPKLNILYVDDEAVVGAAMRQMFSHHGHDVTVADGGRRALALCQQQRFDLVVSDFTMPEMNGRELACCLKERYPEILFVLVSGWPSAQIPRSEGRGLAEDFLLRKPFRYPALVAALRRIPGWNPSEGESLEGDLHAENG